MSTVLAWVCLALVALSVLAILMWQERNKPLWVRLQPLAVILTGLLILWGLVRYGDALLHWFRHLAATLVWMN